MFSGDFEVHLTGSEWEVEGLAAFAARRGAKFSHIELHRGATPSQPMITLTGRGTLEQVRATASRWRADIEDAGLRVLRVKVEAAPWNEGVPRTDDQARPDLYFEHHVKLRLPRDDWKALSAVLDVAKAHNAHLSRNARRRTEGRKEERFVTQRCHGVGRATARARLDALLEALRRWKVLEVEEEYVVHDDALEVDRGWIDAEDDWRTWVGHRDERDRSAPAGLDGYPATYRPLVVGPRRDVRQRAAFDPALKQFVHAFRAGEPVFGDPAEGERWTAARRAAMAHVLAVVAGSRWAGNLVLRGSVVLRAWFGEAAREPGDLDFVVVPREFAADGAEASAMPADLVAALAADPGPGLRAEGVTSDWIWTYERVPGRRLVVPFDVPGLPGGSVQLDFVFNEHLPEPPVTVTVGVPVLAASPGLSLAWKLQWLMTDSYPQGKDLYDAVLLAEHTTTSLALVRELIRPELGALADGFTPESVLSLEVDWDNFRSDRPDLTGDARDWLHRLATALQSSVD
ncbi:nucleotidyl transferase AbiEii/AbiGii toxin family protein [Saccharothrix sp. NPDC042600]|uniref:nucleotidyl transferase AbiEii/AbiGii toxin family protein n=1 Tax=Saccharothrix TaxID=2071 RepID=UPI0033FF3AEB